MMFLLRSSCIAADALRAATGRAPVAAAAAGVAAARRTASRSSGGLAPVCAHASAARGGGGRRRTGGTRSSEQATSGDAVAARASAQRQRLFGGGAFSGGGAVRDRRDNDGDDGDGFDNDDRRDSRGPVRGGGGGGRFGGEGRGRGRGFGGSGGRGGRGRAAEARTAADEVADLIERQRQQQQGGRPGRGGRGATRGGGRGGRGARGQDTFAGERRRRAFDDDGDSDDDDGGTTSLGKSRRAGARIAEALRAELDEATARRRAAKKAAAAGGGGGTPSDDAADADAAAAAEGGESDLDAAAAAEERRNRKARRAAELAARDPRLTGGVQPTLEERAAEAAGVKRSFARAEALPEGLWERLRTEYLEAPLIVKIGRRGATTQLADAVHAAWRTREVVKLRVHDDKSARNAVLPRFNVMLRELEEVTGGVLVDVRGTSIWLYRGEHYEPRAAKGPLVIDTAKLIKAAEPRGTWRTLGGCRCYETAPEGGSGSGSGSSGSSGGSDLPPPLLVVLPDLVALDAHAPATLQVCDHLAAVGGFRIVLADLLGASPEDSWPRERWPPESVWKPRYDNWSRVGPGAWPQQRDRVAAVVEAALAEQQQQQGEEEGSSSSQRYAIAGIGWGARMALWAATNGALDCPPAAVACLSPTLRDTEDEALAKALNAPAALLPPKRGRMDRLQVFLSTRKPIYNRCLFRRFGHCDAGLLSYAPDFTDYDPSAKAGEAFARLRAVHEATEMLAAAAEFLNQHLAAKQGADAGDEEGAGDAGDGGKDEGEPEQ